MGGAVPARPGATMEQIIGLIVVIAWILGAIAKVGEKNKKAGGGLDKKLEDAIRRAQAEAARRKQGSAGAPPPVPQPGPAARSENRPWIPGKDAASQPRPDVPRSVPPPFAPPAPPPSVKGAVVVQPAFPAFPPPPQPALAPSPPPMAAQAAGGAMVAAPSLGSAGSPGAGKQSAPAPPRRPSPRTKPAPMHPMSGGHLPKTRAELRRMVVAAEIFGKPVSLRGPGPR